MKGRTSMAHNDTAIELVIKQHLVHVRILVLQLSGQPTGKEEIYRLISTLVNTAEKILAGQIDERMITALDRVADSLDTVLEDDYEGRFRPARFVQTA
jgi:hypothetical protein